jgi:hypothetical protein
MASWPCCQAAVKAEINGKADYQDFPDTDEKASPDLPSRLSLQITTSDILF